MHVRLGFVPITRICLLILPSKITFHLFDMPLCRKLCKLTILILLILRDGMVIVNILIIKLIGKLTESIGKYTDTEKHINYFYRLSVLSGY